MYAVMTTGGKQYRVEAGNELVIERLTADAGASVTFDRVLLVGDGEAVTVGTPTVDGASVSGTVLGEELGPKLIIFKFKQKVKYRRSAGHRQHLMRVRIDEISTPGKTTRADKPATEKSEKAQKPPKAEKPAKAATPARAASKAPADEPATASVEAEATGKPKRTRKPAAQAADAEATDATQKPKAKPAARRRSPAKKAESKE